jgi:Predicted nucleic acid-binding protein, contains PIN domain
MKKLKLYLDTSVISHLKQDDVPDKMADTLQLWEEIKQGKYDIYISNVTIGEILDCPEPKRSVLRQYLTEIKYTLVDFDDNDEVEQMAQQIIDNKILTPKSYDDCLHISGAVVYGCDIIVSWNFKHMVNYKTINGVKVLSYTNGYKIIEIFTPTIMIGADKNE